MMLSGCGGSGAVGVNSEMEVVLTRTDGSQDIRDYEVFITKSADLSLDRLDHEDYLSSTNQPSWADNYTVSRSNTTTRIGFRTRSSQSPYFVFVGVPVTANPVETVEFAINVDTTPGPVRIYSLASGFIERLTSVTINRNSANY